LSSGLGESGLDVSLKVVHAVVGGHLNSENVLAKNVSS
jgi:hypothetical protein